MRIFKTVSNVEQLDFFHNNELIQLFDSTLFLNGELLASNISYYIKVQKELFICYKDKTTKKFNLLNRELDIFKDIYPFSEPINNEFLLSSDEEFDNIIQKRIRRIDIYSYPLNEKIYTTKNKYHFFQSLWLGKNYIFNTSINQTLLTNLEIKTETTLWQYSVAELGADKVSRILGVFGQVLVVVCEMQRKTFSEMLRPVELYIGLDISSGKLLWQTEDVELPNGQKAYLASILNRWQWQQEQTTLNALSENSFYEFDTQSGRISLEQDLEASLNQINLNTIHSNDMQDNMLYFRAVNNTVGGFQSAIGAFDIETRQITWHHTLHNMVKDGAFIKPGQPQISGNKIYVHDSNNTLHILERETV